MKQYIVAIKRFLPFSVLRALTTIKRQLRRIRYRGDKYHCNICNKSYRTFFDFGVDAAVFQKEGVVGGGRRKSVCCPGCGSLERHRLLTLYLDSIADRNLNSVLHFAPESNITQWFRSRETQQYITADLFADRVDEKIDVTDIGKKNESYDMVICNHVLEHVPNDTQAMRETVRVLKPGGVAILQVPIAMDNEQTLEDRSVTDPADRERLYGQFDHVRLYGSDYIDRLNSAGFEVEQWLPDKDVLGKIQLNPRETLFPRHRLSIPNNHARLSV